MNDDTALVSTSPSTSPSTPLSALFSISPFNAFLGQLELVRSTPLYDPIASTLLTLILF